MKKKTNSESTISLIIPTLNPGCAFESVVNSIFSQTMIPDEIIIVDSSSTDGSLDFINGKKRISLYKVERSSFDHGRTRDFAIRKASGEFIIMLTQDALLYDKYSIEYLVGAIAKDDRIAVVGGKQIAYPQARNAEKLIRQFNYTDKSSCWSKKAISELGIKAFMISDVFAIYRRSAYFDCGGFDFPILTNEDMLMAQKFLEHDYLIGYESSACVYHSHDYTLRQEYMRNKNIGYTLEVFKKRFNDISEYGRGFDLVIYVSLRLLKGLHFISFVLFGLNCIARILGNRAGRRLARRSACGQG